MKTNSRQQRSERLGLDCTSEVIWRHWEPATLYSKKIVLRNVGTKVQRVKHGLPRTKFFRVEFPKKVQIPPGVSFAITVSFTPFQKQEYEDSLEIAVSQVGGVKETFAVALKAVLPSLSVSFPPPIDFGTVAFARPQSRTFALKNTSADVAVRFSWKACVPFAVAPAEGDLAPGATATLTASFSPPDAAPYTSVAVCVLNSGADFRTLQLSGSCKYSFFRISPAAAPDGQQQQQQQEQEPGRVDFGAVTAGHRATKEVVITNPSPVPCAVEIKRADQASAGVFAVSPAAVELGAGESATVRFTFVARTAGARYSEVFVASSPSVPMAPQTRVQCVGEAGGSAVALAGPAAVSFGAIAVGTSTSRMVALHNAGDDDAAFEWTTDEPNRGVFRFEPSQGSVPRKGTVQVAVRFHPSHAVAFAKRVFCIVDHQPPLALDVMGTGYDGDGGERPPTLCPRHVDAAAALAAHEPDLRRLPPDRLEEVLSQREKDEASGRRRVARFSDAAQASVPATPTTSSSSQPPPPPPPAEAVPPQELFSRFTDGGGGGGGEVRALEEFVDFGQCTAAKGELTSSIRIRNGTLGRITCVWASNSSSSGTGSPQQQQKVFVVFPSMAELEPGQTYSFKVAFNPKERNRGYGQDIEFYAFFKAMRSFRLVGEKTTLPPWHGRIPVFGHTFGDGPERLAYKVVPESTSVSFATCSARGSDCQTVRISSTGESGASFAFEVPHDARATFACFPAHGYIPAGQFRIVVFRFTPQSPGKLHATARATVNGRPEPALDVSLAGQCSAPRVLLENNGRVAFRPTCLGTSSSRTLAMRNATGLNLIFRCTDLDQCRGAFQVHPASGVLRANEELALHCSFTPRAARAVQAKVAIVLSGSDPSLADGLAASPVPGAASSATGRSEILFTGQGTEGTLCASPRDVDFGSVLVGGTARARVTVTNNTHSHVRFEVAVLQEGKLAAASSVGRSGGEDGDDEPAGDEEEEEQDLRFEGSEGGQAPLIVEPSSGVIAARSDVDLTFTFRPGQRRRHAFTVRVYIASAARLGSRQAAYSGGRRSPPPAGAESAGSPGGQPHVRETAPGPVACTISLRGAGALPTLAITNVHHAGCVLSKAALWKLLEVSRVNEELCSDLTHEEELFDRARGDQMGESLEARLTEFTVPFGASALGSPPTVLMLRVSNVGPIQVGWTARFRDKPQVRHEPWMAVHEDLTGYEQKQAAALASRVFVVEPMSGELAPGASAIIRLTHSHEVGVQEDSLPLVLHVSGGKSLLLKLTGATLPAGTAAILHPQPTSRTATVITRGLLAAPVGRAACDTPVQFYPLRNPSRDVPVQYSFDTSFADKLRASSFGFEVFGCLAHSGAIPPGGIAHIGWTFCPLEVRQYTCSTTVTSPSGGDPRPVCIAFRGTGFHPRDESEMAPSDDSEAAPTELEMPRGFAFPGQHAAVLPDIVPVGTVPLGAAIHRLVLLRNVDSAGRQLSFAWEASPSESLPPFQRTMIEPRSGTLKPGATAVCKLTLIGLERPAVFDFDVPCKVVATAPAASEADNPLEKAVRPESAELVIAVNTTGVSRAAPRTFGQASPEPAAPPEGASQAPAAGPEESTVFVTIRAHTVTLEAFKASGRSLAEFDIQPGLALVPSQLALPSEKAAEAAEFSSAACSSMLNDVMHDPELLQALEDTTKHQLPYFQQLGTKQEPDVSQEDLAEDQAAAAAARARCRIGPTEFEQFAQSAIDATLTNLMKEAVAAAWDLTSL